MLRNWHVDHGSQVTFMIAQLRSRLHGSLCLETCSENFEESFLRLSLPEQLAILLSLINCRDRSLMPVQPELHRVHEDQPLKAHSSWQAIEHGLDDRTSKVYRDCISQFVSLTAKWLSLETLYSKIGPNKCCLSSTFSYTNIIRIIAYDCPLLASFPTESSLINQLAGWPRT